MSLPKFMQERTDKPLADRYVSMSNALARAAHGLTLAEKRVVAIGLAKTDSMPAASLLKAQVSGWAVRVSAAEYCESFGVDSNTAYDALQGAANNMIHRNIRVFEQTSKGLKEKIINWCGQAIYHHGEGWLELHFTPFVAPHLLALRGQFISYQLRHTQALRSIYAWRLLECLNSWKETGLWRVSIAEFIGSMDAPESCQKDFGAMRARIIQPAIKELEAKNGWVITWTATRAGRKVIGLEFRFEVGPQAVLDFE